MTTVETVFLILASLLMMVGLFLHGRRTYQAVRAGEPPLTWLGVLNVQQRLRLDPLLLMVGMILVTDVLENLGKWPEPFWQSLLLFLIAYLLLLVFSHQIGLALGQTKRSD